MEVKKLNYFSVCDGIGAAHVAWKEIPELQCVGTSEIEPFPAAVVENHFGYRNYGDMTKLLQNPNFNEQSINLLIGGTPCQSFSVAGLRGGLDDERGNLSLEFARILYSKRCRWFLWENVPGVLSSNAGADYAAILSAWTGHDLAAQPFPESGILPAATPNNYSLAYRILDAQYFGVPQRRRRVFVVGYLGTDWRPPTAVLFERNSLRRDFTPGKEARQKLAQSIASGVGEASINNRINDTVTSKWAKGSGGPAGNEVQNVVLQGPVIHAYNFENIAEDEKLSPTIGAERSKDTFIYGIDQSINANAEHTNALMSSSNGQVQHGAVTYGMAGNLIGRSENAGPNGLGFIDEVVTNIARRLTPLECERLQGFPDNYTKIKWNSWRPMHPTETPEGCIGLGMEVRQTKKASGV